ncbi:MAG: endonuclease/exonuclease/phosphatase family protein [bacterium]
MATAIPPLQDSEKLEFGGPTQHWSADPTKSRLVIASYNIRYAVGRFLISSGLLRKLGINRNSKRAHQVGENIRQVAEFFSSAKLMPIPDVVALQEADKQTLRSGGHHVAREIAEALRLSWVHAPAGIPRGQAPVARQWWLDFEEQIGLHDTGDTGVALLSRYPLEEVTRIDLPWRECPWRPRLAMAATIALGSNELRILNAHVDPHAAIGGQLEQLEALAAEAEKHSGPTLVVGDFNTLSRQKCAETRSFMEARGFRTPIPTGTPTWRGAGIRLHADWIFYRDLKITNWGVARPLNVSDHWPIWAEIVVE